MIVVETSALISIFAEEEDSERYARCIASDDAPYIAVSSVLECSMVIRGSRRLESAQSEVWLDSFLASGRVTIEPIGLEDLKFARNAHIQYGKGSGHPAQLNFGDCFSYALAKRLNAPLLYKGGDFSRTDIKSAL